MSKDVKIYHDKDVVYLEIEDVSDCCFELWEIGNKKVSRVKVKIPKKQWKSIIKKERGKDESL